MFRRLLFVAFLCCANCTYAQDTLPTITVTASTGQPMLVPLFLVTSNIIPTYHEEAASISDDPESPLTKDQICKAIKDNAPSGCNVTNPPSAPGLPSPTQGMWQPNHCGPGGWMNDVLSNLLYSKYQNPEIPGGSLYSGDLNKPVLTAPDADFTAACDAHDACYTSAETKHSCDADFGSTLETVCLGKDSMCLAFKGDYYDAVDQHGQDAYDTDQAQLSCAIYAKVYTDNQCSE